MDQGPVFKEKEFVVYRETGPASELTLLLNHQPWLKIFCRNLKDLLWPSRQPSLVLSSRPAEFWPDVFVASHLPWRRFLESSVYHIAVIAGLCAVPYILPSRPQIADRPVFNQAEVIYFSPSEYLPPLDTGSQQMQQPQRGEPEYAPQSVLSVPPEADNRSQTIVSPPSVRLNHDVPLPNIVAWSKPAAAMPIAATANIAEKPRMTLPVDVVAPSPETTKINQRMAPYLEQSAIAPPPEIRVTSPSRILVPQPVVAAPPPLVNVSSIRRLGEMNIGHADAIAPAPRLPVSEQHALNRAEALGNSAPQVVPPPPSIQQTGGASRGARLIALNVRPVAPAGPVEAPAGNRRGTFAATPQGRAGAAGTPDIRGEGQTGSKGIGFGSSANDAPSGLLVGQKPDAANTSIIAGQGNGTGSGNTPSKSAGPVLVANATASRVGGVPRKTAVEASDINVPEAERRVFGGRKSYSLTLNMPNLNSAGGSWVIRFAELQTGKENGDLIAPEAVQKVDPSYPLELIRHNVQGTVTLYAVIHSDGSVGDVRVLQGVDDRLDEYARAALSRWRFSPAMKNGNAVALEAVVRIPFRSGRMKSGF